MLYDIIQVHFFGGIMMKKIKVNEKLMSRIVSGGLSLVLVASGFALGKFSSKNNNSNDEYLQEYIAERSTLEQEIEELLRQKEELQKSETFDVSDLIVIEHTMTDGKSNLFILYPKNNSIYYEYHNSFKAFYKLHDYTEEHVHGFCSEYVHFSDGEPLFDYLTDDEIEKITKNGGKITTLDLDKILIRMRNDYQKQLSEENYSKSLTNY